MFNICGNIFGEALLPHTTGKSAQIINWTINKSGLCWPESRGENQAQQNEQLFVSVGCRQEVLDMLTKSVSCNYISMPQICTSTSTPDAADVYIYF